MGAGLSAMSCLDLKRKIAELDRTRTQMRLDLVKLRAQPESGTDEDLADIENSLILLEDDRAELARRYEEGCPS